MKNIKYILALLCGVFLLQSCSQDDTQRLLFEQNQKIDTERSAFYNIVGILEQLQAIGDNYVILGEMRGDLMAVTDNSPKQLSDIYKFEADSSNTYIIPKKYYAIINNCNNLIAKIDTSLIVYPENATVGVKSLKNVMNVTKTIRSWLYFQLYMEFGKVNYYEHPILDVKDQNKYTEISDFNQLSDTLIADLESYVPADGIAEIFPNYGSIGDFSSTKLFIPARFILGDLYLNRGEYAKAANMYYQLILTNKLKVLGNRNAWNDNLTSVTTTDWQKLFTDLSLNEQLSIIGYSADYSNLYMLSSLANTTNYWLAPSTTAINNWESQTYSITNNNTMVGDLRGKYGSYTTATKNNALNEVVYYPKIAKYDKTVNYISLCRASLVYLRYAEAINRLGKPNMAFVFLKYGLNKTSLISYASKEISTKQSYLEFGQNSDNIDAVFSSNIAMRARGCNKVDLNNSFKFPTDGTDSITWVEDQLVTEYALETAFEGNRFNDLMRIANRRNDPAYLATKVASKFPVEQQSVILERLKIKKNWFLPIK